MFSTTNYAQNYAGKALATYHAAYVTVTANLEFLAALGNEDTV